MYFSDDFSHPQTIHFYLRIRPGEEIVRGYDQSKGEAAKSNPQMARKAQVLSKYAHAVIFVVKANDPRLKDGKYKDTLKKIREHFREDGKMNIGRNSVQNLLSKNHS